MTRRQVVITMFAALWSGSCVRGFAQSADGDDPAASNDDDWPDDETAVDGASSVDENQDDAGQAEDGDDRAASNDDDWRDDETTADASEDDASSAGENQDEAAQAEDGDATPDRNGESTESAGGEQPPETPRVSGAVNVNDDAGLEREADVMGAKAQNGGRLEGNANSAQKKIADGGPPAPDATTGALMVSEHDGQAVALGYVADAAKLDKARYRQYVAGQTCATCAQFVGRAAGATGGCPLFGTKQVAARGWCTAWARKG